MRIVLYADSLLSLIALYLLVIVRAQRKNRPIKRRMPVRVWETRRTYVAYMPDYKGTLAICAGSFRIGPFLVSRTKRGRLAKKA